MANETLTLAEQDQIALLTFKRPDKRNAISRQLIQETLLALDQVQRGSARVLMLTGAGSAFCSGMDLEELKAITTRSAAQNREDSETMARLFRSIHEFPRPTIAAVNGPAIAGGCGLATLCDFTIASSEAKFGYTEVRIGFVPAIVSAWLVRQVGDKTARDLLLTGKIISAEEAWRIGLVTEVVEPARLVERAREIAMQLIKNSPASLAATKRLLNSYSERDLNRQLTAAVKANAAIRTTDDFREGINSFLEKRKPDWGPAGSEAEPKKE